MDEPDRLHDVLATLDGRREQALASLKQFLAIPSVSTDPAHADDVRRCAHWLADAMRFAEFETSVMETPGHPVVVAKNRHQAGRPTVLFYGHYDVQPPDPLDLWTTPPFEPDVRDARIYARGASDDKGPVWAHVEALTAWQAHGGPPVNVTVLVEGEEENASENLEHFVRYHRESLRADVAVVSDTGQFARGQPAITYGLRGLCYQEVILHGPSRDLHSGVFGGTVSNPASALARILASLHDDDGRVTIPGFYDAVRPLDDVERKAFADLPFDEEAYKRDLGLSVLPGETGYSPLERVWARPTLDVNGLTSGYQGAGAKTVLPARASAKVSMRLVPDQGWKIVREQFRKAVEARVPVGCRVEFVDHGGIDPGLVPHDSRAARLAAEAVEVGFGVKPVFTREGGSIPVGALFKRELGVDTLFVGFGLADDRIHSPDEKMDLDAFYAGTRTAAALYGRLGRL